MYFCKKIGKRRVKSALALYYLSISELLNSTRFYIYMNGRVFGFFITEATVISFGLVLRGFSMYIMSFEL